MDTPGCLRRGRWEPRQLGGTPAHTVPKPGARAGKGGAGTNKGAAVAGGAAKLDAARVRAWRLRGRQGVYRDANDKRWYVRIHYGEELHLGRFKTKEDAIACRLLGEDRIAAGCNPKTGKYVPEAKRPKPPMTRFKNNAHLLGTPAQMFSDAALGERATDLAAKVDAGTLDIDQVAGVHLHKKTGKWRAEMGYKKKTYLLGSHTSDLAEAIRYRLLAEKAKELFPDKNPQDYVAARTGPAAGAAGGASKKRKRSTTVHEEEEEGAGAEETAPPLRRRRTRSTNEAPAKTSPTTDADAGGDDDHDAYAAGDDDEADTDADADELRDQLAGQRKVVLALREALGRSGRDAEAYRREAVAHRREAEAQRQEIEAHRREAEAHRVEVEAQRCQTERLRREVARLQAEDGHCARSRPYYWQR